jgi:hypothetical protein
MGESARQPVGIRCRGQRGGGCEQRGGGIEDAVGSHLRAAGSAHPVAAWTVDDRDGQPRSSEEGDRIRSSGGRTRKDKGRSCVLVFVVEREALAGWELVRLEQERTPIPYGARGNDRTGPRGEPQ